MSHESKAAAIKAIMNNPKIAKMIDEAFSSPLGSTKRARVKDIISTVKKITDKKYPDKNDGKGGDPMTPRVASSMQPAERNSYSNVKIFPAAPKMKSQEYNQGPKFDGAGGAPDGQGGSWGDFASNIGTYLTGKGYEAPGSYMSGQYTPQDYINTTSLADWNKPGQWGKKTAAIAGEALNTLGNLKSQGLNLAARAAWTPVEALEAGTEYVAGNILGAKNLADTSGYQNLKLMWGGANKPSDTATKKQQQGVKTGGEVWIDKDGVNWAKNPDGSMTRITDQKMLQDYIVNKKYIDKRDTSKAPGAKQTTATSTSPEPIRNPSEIYKYNVTGKSADGKTLMGTLKPQYANKMEGPQEKPLGYGNTTTTGTTSTTGSTGSSSTTPSGKFSDVLSAVANHLGPQTFAMTMMNDPEKLKKLGYQYSGGGSLSKMNDDLNNALKKETGLDNSLKRLTDLQNNGMNLQDDLVDYIKNKDTYIDDVNKVINTTNEALLKASDPTEERRLKNHLNYLYTLKGRQNQRYIDFIKTDMDQYNKDLATAQNDYNQKKTDYDNRLASGIAMNQEEYTKTYNGLMDLYNQLDGLDAKSTQQALLDQQLWAQQAANGVFGPEKAALVNGSKSGATSNKSYYEEIPKYEKYLISTDDTTKGQLRTDIDIMNEVAKVQSQGMDPNGVLEVVSNGIKNSMSGLGGSGTLSKIGEIKNMIDKFDSDIQSTNNGQYITANGLRNTLAAAAAPAIQKYVESTGDLTSVIEDLVGTAHWLSKPYGTTSADKAKFIANNKGNLNDTALLGAIFDQYASSVKSGNFRPTDVFGKPGDIDSQTLAANVAAGVMPFVLKGYTLPSK